MIRSVGRVGKPHRQAWNGRARGAEHRQTIAHGVSRGFPSRIETSPGRGDRIRSPPEAAFTRAMLPRIRNLRVVGILRGSRHASRLRPRRNGVATSSSPFLSDSQGDEDIAAPKPF